MNPSPQNLHCYPTSRIEIEVPIPTDVARWLLTTKSKSIIQLTTFAYLPYHLPYGVQLSTTPLHEHGRFFNRASIVPFVKILMQQWYRLASTLSIAIIWDIFYPPLMSWHQQRNKKRPNPQIRMVWRRKRILERVMWRVSLYLAASTQTIER